MIPLDHSFQAPSEPPQDTNTPFKSIVLVLQGGGALGAYQAGVYEALAEKDIAPTWVAGISIGAVNSAIIAGNPKEKRVEKLRAFWDQVALQPPFWFSPLPDFFRDGDARGVVNQFAAMRVLTSGVPGFFSPRFPPPPFNRSGTPGSTSWYDVSDLRGTLERLVDFDRINTRETRFSVGAVNVRTGNFTYFDNAKDKIRPEHVMASGALPPGFPAVEIDGEHYWDGGMVSNTPLEWALSVVEEVDTLVFQVDLWSARGEVPRDLSAVAVRMKEIQYSSRTRRATTQFRNHQRLRAAMHSLLEKMPEDLAQSPEAQLLAAHTDPAVYNIVQLIYRSPTYEGQSKDYEFSRQTMQDHWQAGYRDAMDTLTHQDVLTLPTDPFGVEVFDFVSHREPVPIRQTKPIDG